MEALLAIGIFAVAIGLLSLGTVVFRRPLRGSCGVTTGQDGTCGVCGRAPSECPEDGARS
jgi:hypothetical protein